MDFRTVTIPFHDHLGLVIEEGSPSRVTLPLAPEVRGAVAPLHGGVVATLVDVACASAIGTDTYDPTVEVPVSTDLQVKFFRQPKEGPVVARGSVVHRGRTVIVSECVVEDALGRQVARGSGTYLLVGGFHDHAG